MAIKKKKIEGDTKYSEDNIEQYTHNDKKRAYNPPVGLVTPQTDKDLPRRKYSHDPHIDPQLIWSGRKENTSFEVDTVSLHVHERVDPITIIENVLKKQKYTQQTLFHYFELPENNLPNRQAIEFYKHDQNWSNRLIAGDSLLVMNSLLQKESMSGKIQMIYIDPPYGIKYGSNFQPFVDKREVKDGKDEDLTQEPEMIKAFRDTWELGIHSYLSYLRDRIVLAKDLLTDTGSIFIQISDENIHHVREILDEIFGSANFVSQIFFKKTTGAGSSSDLLSTASVGDYLLWYAKDAKNKKFRHIFVEKEFGGEGSTAYKRIELHDNTRTSVSQWEKQFNQKFDYDNLPKGAKIFALDNLTSQSGGESSRFPVIFRGKTYTIQRGSWKTNQEGISRLIKANRIDVTESGGIGYVRYFEDFKYMQLSNLWTDTVGQNQFGGEKKYAVQTALSVVERCMLMTTDPGDIVFDPTCGSGTTAFIAEKLGRRWITCDTSRVAITLTKQRLMTSLFDYYELNHPSEGIASGLKYKTVKHITLRSIARNEPPTLETLYNQPFIDKTKTRISGPFTVEAVPSPIVKSPDSELEQISEIDQSLSRVGEASRQDEWRDEISKTGIRGKGGQKIEFSRVEILPGTQWIHADSETKEEHPKRAVISFGPDYGPLEPRQVANAIEEAQNLVPKPQIILFVAFQFDPEAAKDIDELNWPGVTLLKVQMNGDLFTEDLKKKRSSSESFWLMGQPDIELIKQKDGKYVVEVRGFDYYNTKTGEIESGDSSKIAMWELDTDYDERSLYPRQSFFPMSGAADGWSKLAKTLSAEIDEDKIEQYRGTTSLPFDLGFNKKIAVKIIDNRGIESLRIIRVK